MTSLRNAFFAALKSLLKGKSFLQALIAFWVNPSAVKEGVSGRNTTSTTTTSNPATATSNHDRSVGTTTVAAGRRRAIEDFLREAEGLLLRPVGPEDLPLFSSKLKTQLRERLWSNHACMLPSYNHQLPNGSERGRYLALDVGGSTLRVALVELNGREATGEESRIVRISTFKIEVEIKNLEGMAFFDWMATRILETIESALEGPEHSLEKPIPMGLAWSFPIEQTSLKGGLLQGMGKGFLAANGLVGQDLGDIIQFACRKQGFNVELAAIVNDSSAALLSESYRSPSTRFGLILGTGFNIAVHLPVSTIDRPKFGNRPASWFDKASHVIINTEMGMFGSGILPFTRWDEQLNASHPKPEFQPLEHFVAGYYLGEIVRLALAEAVESTGLFGGVMPENLRSPYSLDTETISIIEGDTAPLLATAISTFSSRHPSSPGAPHTPTVEDMIAVRTLASLVTRRSAAIVAAAVHALWQLKAEAETEYLLELSSSSSSSSAASSPALVNGADEPPAATAGGNNKNNNCFAEETRAELALDRLMVAFNGSVIEQYPGYLANCQRCIDGLLRSAAAAVDSDAVVAAEAGAGAKLPVSLVPAKESSLLGAAVALACLEEGKAN